MGINQGRGRGAETLAAAYLALVGCVVTARNVRLGGVEVDLVASDGATRVIVEVKFRGRDDFGGAVGAVDHLKMRRLRRAASALQQSGATRVRIDVVAIGLDAEGARLRHVRNAITE